MTKLRFFNSSPSYFTRFIRTYLLLMTISFLVAMITYYIAINALEEYAIDANTSLLESRITAIEYRIDEIDTMAKLIFTNPKILAFNDVINPYDGANVIDLLDLQQFIKESYPVDNELIQNFFICYRASQVAVSPFNVFSLEELHREYYSHTNYDTWHNQLLGQYLSGEFPYADANAVDGTSVPYLTYTQSIGSSRKLIGTILIQIDNQLLSEIVLESPHIEKGFMYILDENNRLLSSYSYGQEHFVHFIENGDADAGYLFKDYQGQKYLITYLTSDVTGWKYTDIKPVGETMENVYRIQNISYWIIGLSIVIGLIAAYFIARVNVKPIDQLIDSNTLLRHEIQEQLPLLKATFIERLISGLIISEGDLKAQCDHLEINPESLLPQAILIKITGYEQYQDKITIQQLSLERLQVTTAIKRALGTTELIHNSETDKVLILLKRSTLGNIPLADFLEHNLGDLLDALSNEHNINTVVGIGGAYSSLIDISRSYKEALQAVSFRLYHQQHRFASYADLPKSTDIFYFPDNVESKLINLIKAGDLAKVNELLKDIYEENFIQRQLKPSMISNLLNLMWSCNIKLLDDVRLDLVELRTSIERTSERFDNLSDIEKLQQTMEVYRSICEKTAQEKKSNNQSLINEIIEHLKLNVADGNLSLVGVATKFDITDVYLSGFFKEQTGINFSKYIEQLRMDLARQMLTESDALINEIVSATGYLSSNAFGRAFKRINGMSASSYRQTFKNHS